MVATTPKAVEKRLHLPPVSVYVLLLMPVSVGGERIILDKMEAPYFLITILACL